MADSSGDPTWVLPTLGFPVLDGSWGGFTTFFFPCSAVSHVSSNRSNGTTVPNIYSVIYFWVTFTFGGEGLTSIDHLILSPSKPIWCHSHILLLSKLFDPAGIIWIFPTYWVISGLALIFSCLPPQFHCKDRLGTSHTHLSTAWCRQALLHRL